MNNLLLNMREKNLLERQQNKSYWNLKMRLMVCKKYIWQNDVLSNSLKFTQWFSSFSCTLTMLPSELALWGYSHPKESWVLLSKELSNNAIMLVCWPISSCMIWNVYINYLRKCNSPLNSWEIFSRLFTWHSNINNFF